MSDHTPTSQMERFCARALPVPELVSIGRHLASCKTCHQLFQETIERRRDYVPVSFTLAPEKWLQHEHLAYEQLVTYVENSLDTAEQEIIDIHLQLCGQCDENLRSFQRFRQQTGTELADVHVSDVQPSWRDKVLFGWNWLTTGWKPVYATAAAVAIFCLIIFAAVMFERNKTNDQQARQSQPEQSKEAVSTPSVNSSNIPTPANRNNDVAIAAAPTTNTNSSNKVEVSPQPNTNRPSSSQQKVMPERVRPSLGEAVALNDGQDRVVIDNSGNLTGLDNLSPETQQTIKEVLLARNIERPAALSEIMGEASPLRGTAAGGPPFRLLSPARTVIANDRPTFNWTKVVGATSYRVQVVDSRNREVANSGELPSTLTAWTLPKPLARGVVYTWVVTAVVDSREVIAPSASEPEMRFKIADEATLREINALQKDNRSHLALGILYARAGMIAEAERELQILVKQNPTSSVAQKLLCSIQSWQ